MSIHRHYAETSRQGKKRINQMPLAVRKSYLDALPEHPSSYKRPQPTGTHIRKKSGEIRGVA